MQEQQLPNVSWRCHRSSVTLFQAKKLPCRVLLDNPRIAMNCKLRITGLGNPYNWAWLTFGNSIQVRKWNFWLKLSIGNYKPRQYRLRSFVSEWHFGLDRGENKTTFQSEQFNKRFLNYKWTQHRFSKLVNGRKEVCHTSHARHQVVMPVTPIMSVVPYVTVTPMKAIIPLLTFIPCETVTSIMPIQLHPVMPLDRRSRYTHVTHSPHTYADKVVLLWFRQPLRNTNSTGTWAQAWFDPCWAFYKHKLISNMLLINTWLLSLWQ